MSRNGTHLGTVNLLPGQGRGRPLIIDMIASVAVFYYRITRIWILWPGSTRSWTDLWRLLWHQGWQLWRGTRLPRWTNRYNTSYQAATVSIIFRSPTRGTQSWGWWCRRVQTRPTCTVTQTIIILQLRLASLSKPAKMVNSHLCNIRWTGGSRSHEYLVPTPCSLKAVLVPETLSLLRWSMDRCCDMAKKKFIKILM